MINMDGQKTYIQCFNIMKRKLFSQLEVDQLYITFLTQEELEKQLDAQLTSESGTFPPPPLQSTNTNMAYKIMDQLAAGYQDPVEKYYQIVRKKTPVEPS